MSKSAENDPETVSPVSQETVAEPDKMAKVNWRIVLAFVLTLLVKGIRRFWALCTTFLLILLLLYWLYGSTVTLALIIMAIIGEYLHDFVTQ